MFSPTYECALVPPGLLDVYGSGKLCCHVYLGKEEVLHKSHQVFISAQEYVGKDALRFRDFQSPYSALNK